MDIYFFFKILTRSINISYIIKRFIVTTKKNELIYFFRHFKLNSYFSSSDQCAGQIRDRMLEKQTALDIFFTTDTTDLSFVFFISNKNKGQTIPHPLNEQKNHFVRRVHFTFCYIFYFIFFAREIIYLIHLLFLFFYSPLVIFQCSLPFFHKPLYHGLSSPQSTSDIILRKEKVYRC